MKLPEAFLKGLQLPQSELADFVESLDLETPTSVRFNSAKAKSLLDLVPVTWAVDGYYLPERPRFTSDPAFHAGAYYPQEASSMFLSLLLRGLELDQSPIAALDLCAAPGGKSNLLRSELHKDSFLLANETIASRAKILDETLSKWGISGVAISQKDPSVLGRLTDVFDLILVDAPCSGEGLFRKNTEAVDQWSLDAVNLCRARQRRILADIWPALKPGGVLIYSTCTYNREENEDNLHWLSQNGASAVDVDFELPDGIIETETNGIKGYRFMPHRITGEGFFIGAVQKDSNPTSRKPKKVRSPYRAYQNSAWQGSTEFLEDAKGNVHALPKTHLNYLEMIAAAGIYLYKPGLLVGKDVAGQFKPDHGYALIPAIAKAFPSISLSLEDATRYLSRADLTLTESAVQEKVLLEYEGFNLGFGKVRNGRITSEYPIHWRILKAAPEQYTRIAGSIDA